MNFQKILKTERERQGLSYRELGRRAGLTERCISYLESGRRKSPTLDTAEKILKALGVTYTIGANND